ncbi:NAA15_16 [Mytilus coruscus]|uniref:NAA15_16 n=1 Tax=Mytilus coruscus TaxID=42192 RepID=A0A6J8DG63_MYTCO|nr:NAA15_16 [Mytilus coruscus]
MVTPGQVRYMRCRLAVDDVLTQIMKEYMEQSGTQPSSIESSILNNNTFMNRLYPDEMRIIQTLTANGFEHFNISLMYKIARNFSFLISDKPAQKWGTNPREDDCTVGDDMERIRGCRNKFAHVNNPSISKSLFHTLFSRFIQVAQRAEQHLKNTTFVHRLRQYQTCTLDPEMENRFTKLEEKYQQEIAELKKKLVKTQVKVCANATIYMDKLTQETIAESRGENHKEGMMESTFTFPGIEHAENSVTILYDRKTYLSTEAIVFKHAEEGCLVLFVDIAIGLLQDDSLLKREMESFIQRAFKVADLQCFSRENLEVFFSIIEETDRTLETKPDKVEYQIQGTTMAQAQAPREVDTYPVFFQKQTMECLELCKTHFSIDESTFTCVEIG